MLGRTENEQRTEAWLQTQYLAAPYYMKYYMRTFQRKSYTTKEQYWRDVMEFLKYIKESYGYNINDINIFSTMKPSMISGYLDHLNKSEKVINGKLVARCGDSIQCRKFYAIKNFFKFLVNDEYVVKNPCDNVEPPKMQNINDIVEMDEAEVATFLTNVLDGVGTTRAKARQSKWRNRDYAIMTLALALGLRVTSLTEINVDDVDLDSNRVTVTEKGNTTRTLYFSDNIKAALEQWLTDREKLIKDFGIEDCGALFISNQRTRITPKSIRELVSKYTVGIEKHITPHKLRSTCATNVYTETGDIYLTANVLGHSNIQNTRRYAKVVDKKREEATRAMDRIIFG